MEHDSNVPEITDGEMAIYERELTEALGRAYVIATEWLNRTEVRSSTTGLALAQEVGEKIASTATILIAAYSERRGRTPAYGIAIPTFSTAPAERQPEGTPPR
jgi:hypothetical protein